MTFQMRLANLSLANCYFAHDSLGFPSCYGPSMRDLLVLLIHLYIPEFEVKNIHYISFVPSEALG